jgi:hypothetical protein
MGLTTSYRKKDVVQKPNNQPKKLVVKEAKAHPGLWRQVKKKSGLEIVGVNGYVCMLKMSDNCLSVKELQSPSAGTFSHA